MTSLFFKPIGWRDVSVLTRDWSVITSFLTSGPACGSV